jgi:hypothetical protein
MGDLDVARDPESDPSALAALSGSADLDIVIQLALNPSTPPDTLRALNGRWERFERSPRFLWGHFIYNPNCPADILSEIAQHTTNPLTKQRAREHPNFPG